MRYLLAGALGLALLGPAWADDKKTDKADDAPKTPGEKFDDLQKGFGQELNKLGEDYQKAKTPEEKTAIEDKAFKTVAGDVARKMLALAVENQKDPVAQKALVWICTQGHRTAQVPDALNLLLKIYPDSEQLGIACRGLQRRPDGEKYIREVRARTTNKAVKCEAGIFLASALRDMNDQVSTQQAEKLLEEVVAQAKEARLPAQVVAEAADGLKDVRKFGVGKTAPTAESKDLDEKNVALADLKGKVVVLDFWATWCGPCKSMIPHERQIVKKNAGKPFAFVSVSADDEVKTVKEFVEKEPMPWTHWFAGKGGDVLKGWNIHAFPTIYVIDANGVIRGRFIGAGLETEKKLEELVENLVKEAGGKRAD